MGEGSQSRETWVNLINIRRAVPIMLTASDIDYLNFIAKHLSKQRNCDVSMSEAVSFLVKRHAVKMQKQLLDQQYDRKIEAKRMQKVSR